MKFTPKKSTKTIRSTPNVGEKAGSTAGGAYTPPSVPTPKKAAPRWIWIGCIVLVLVAALHSASKSVGGGDTWVAMACGRFTLGPWAKEHTGRTWQMKVLDWFGIHTTWHDPLGARTRPYNPDNKEDIGWVNQNWLTHVLFYKMKTAFDGDPYQPQKGEILIVIYKFVQAILTALFVYWAARVLGAHPLLAASAVAFGMLLSRSFIDLRPNVSSIFFAAIMILLISYWKKGRRWALAGMIPVMIFWSNVHGGFIYAIMIFGILLIGHAIQNYAGKANYAFLLLGFLVVIVLLLSGSENLQEDWKNVDQLCRDRKNIILERGNILAKNDLEGIQSQISYLTTKANTLRAYQIAGVMSAFALLGIIVFSLLRFSQIQPDSFYQAGKRGLKFIGAATGIVVLSPVIFSPFGLENLIHPLIIATGKEGKQWREVIEWKPIWDPQGFGNEWPYQIFLLLFALVSVAWFILYFLKPRMPEVSLRRKKQKPMESFYWPKIDLAQIAIIAITLAMSVKSRRFIFLGGVILAPFLAAMIQEIIHMLRILHYHRNTMPLQLMPMLKPMAFVFAILTLMPIAIIGWKFHQYMDKTYQYKDVLFAKKEPIQSIFRQMVGINAQPVFAMQFFNKYQFQGVIYNEWTHGGYVSFHQKPVPKTGEPPCKVFMDGRAQAAYTLAHYKYWSEISQSARETSSAPIVFSQKLRQDNINMALLDIAEMNMEGQISVKGKPAYEKLIASGEWLLLFNNNRYAVLGAIGDEPNREKIRKALQEDRRSLMLSTCSTPQALKRFFADQRETLQQCYLNHPNVLAEPFIEIKQGRKNLLYNPRALYILFQDHSQDLKQIFTKHTNILQWFIVNQFSALEEIFQQDRQFLQILRIEKDKFNQFLKQKSGDKTEN